MTRCPALGTVSLLAMMTALGTAAAFAQAAQTLPPSQTTGSQATGSQATGSQTTGSQTGAQPAAANAAQSAASQAAVEAAIAASRKAAAKIVAAPPSAAPPDPAPAAPVNDALSVLLRQAEYWRDQNNPPRAIEAAQRALSLSPNNPQALAIIAEVQAGTGNVTEAQQTLALLQQSHPDAPEIHQVQEAVRIGAIDPNALSNARQLAQQGSDAQAVSAYRQLFGGAAAPPDSLAVEYYQTLGGTGGGYQPAVSGLADAVRRNPNDMRAQLAYAQALTYRQDSRLQGIERLAALSSNSAIGPQARESWRQALGWLPLDQTSVAAIKTYQARYPGDPTAASLLANALNPPHQAPGEQFVSEAYDAFHRNDLPQAQQLFGQALAANPNDASATGGLGLVMMREGRSAEATTLLRRAIALDPAHAPAWQQALAGAAVTNEFAAAQSASNRGDLPRAEQAYRALLARQPGNAGIKMALAGVLAREGNQEEANSLLAEVEASGGQISDQARSQLLAQQAQAMPDVAGQIALYRSAVDADPSSPWLRLDLARALVKNGQPADAQAVMSAVTDVSRPSGAALQAGIIFANETGNSAEAINLIGQVPPRQRTADMREALDEARVQGQISSAEAYASSDPAAARQQLLAIAAGRDPSGGRGLAVAKAFIALSDTADAQTAIATAAGANPSAGAGARLLWAQGLLSAGATAGANAMLASVPAEDLTPDQQTSLAGLRNGIAIRSSDALNTAGRTADAYDQLAPALVRSPADPALNSALARLYQTANDPHKALAINERILQNDPNNPEARRGAVAAAIQTGDYALASRFVNDNLIQNPNDPQNWILAADIAQARGLNDDALHDLRQARALRQQQLGDAGVPGEANPSFMVASNGPVGASLGAASNNPFRNAPSDNDGTAPAASQSPPETTPVGILAGTGLVASSNIGNSNLGGSNLGGSPAAAAPDPMIADLDTRIEAIKLQVAPYVSGSTTLQFRSGSAGTGQLATYGVPLEGSFSPGGVGRITFAATPTYLSAGQIASDTGDEQNFGTAVFDNLVNAAFGRTVIAAPGSQNATGLGLDLGYTDQWLSGDIGSTPLGFRVTSIVGGVEIAPTIGQNLLLRLTGERRAVTDSLVAYAGAYDPGTGLTWGGVTRTRVHAQLEFSPGQANFYAGGGYDWLQGQNVLSNNEVELGAGGSYPVYKTPSDEVRVGLNLVYFGYRNNQDHFTLGYGGYFSPQDYVAAIVPVTWTATRGSLTYTLGGSLGLQTFNANGGAIFPNDAALQQLVGQYASLDTSVQGSYASQNVSGVVGGLNGSFEYHLTPELQVGGSAAYQKSADWNEADVMAFARYTFMDAE
jgi:Tfp pilus assembly protein PilF